jgi:uncharacterized Ntn-hydrolase superfamily protein
MFRYVVIIFFLSGRLLPAQTCDGQPLTHTFSIVAIDTASREMGVAVQSHWFSVGSLVSWARSGAGVVATQSLVNPAFGPQGLNLMAQGRSAAEALAELLSVDPGQVFRQVAFIDSRGGVAVHTGSKCIAEAGHYQGKTFSVQANMMMNDQVVPAMARAFENSQGALAERMLTALLAAQQAGGDIRGQQSAAILVVRQNSSGLEWQDRVIDLRVEDHPRAVEEISRLLSVFRAYEHMNNGDLAMEKNNVDQALLEYGTAREMYPDNIEIQFWQAVSLANSDRLAEALPLFLDIFRANENYRHLTSRIAQNKLLDVPESSLQVILNLQ